MGRTKVSQYVAPQGTQEERIMAMLKTLELEAMAMSLKNVEQDIRDKHGTKLDFMESLLEKEFTYKEGSRLARWMQQARFPFKKTIGDFDFDFQPSIDKSEINELMSCRFIGQGKNVIFLGQAGVGKTHLSIALGLEAINRGFEARFLRLDQLIEMVEATDESSSPRLLRTLVRPRLLILDDIDFYDTGKNASDFLFQLMSRRYDERVSTILTSNKVFGDWEPLFGGPRAEAIVDRIIGGAHIININGKSYRTKDNPQMNGLEQLQPTSS